MSNTPDYTPISMSDIRDEVRKLSVAWHENASNWIGDKVKLASDIQNYADQQTASLTERLAISEANFERLKKIGEREWTRVEDEEPPLHLPVLGWTIYQSRIVVKNLPGYKWETANGTRNWEYVTHWYELPPPPTQEKQ